MEGFHRTDSSEKLLVIFSFLSFDSKHARFRSIFLRSDIRTVYPRTFEQNVSKSIFLLKNREIVKMERRKFERIVHSREKSDLST